MALGTILIQSHSQPALVDRRLLGGKRAGLLDHEIVTVWLFATYRQTVPSEYANL